MSTIITLTYRLAALASRHKVAGFSLRLDTSFRYIQGVASRSDGISVTVVVTVMAWRAWRSDAKTVTVRSTGVRDGYFSVRDGTFCRDGWESTKNII